MPRPPADPYAPPPMHRDRSGAFVRIAILAVMIAGAGFGWMYFSSHRQQTAELGAPTAEQRQLADNGDLQSYQANPATAPAPQTAPAPKPTPVRRAAPQRSAPVDVPSETAPPPTTSTTPSTPAPPPSPTPLPPSDQGG